MSSFMEQIKNDPDAALAAVREELEPLGVVVPSGRMSMHICEAWMRDVCQREERVKAYQSRIDHEQNAIGKLRNRISDFIRYERKELGVELIPSAEFLIGARRPPQTGSTKFRNTPQIREHISINFPAEKHPAFYITTPDATAFLRGVAWTEPDSDGDIRPVDANGQEVPGLVRHLPGPDEFSVRWSRKGATP